MPGRMQILCCGLMIFFLLSTCPPAEGRQKKIDEFPPTERGTKVEITIAYPATPFQVDQYFEISITFQVKSFGDMVDQIYVRRVFVWFSVNFRDYSDQGGSFKIVPPDESTQRTFGFYLYADELGIFPGQSTGGRLDYRIKWAERVGSGADIEYDTDRTLIDYIEIQYSALPEGVTGHPLTSIRPIFGFEILSVLVALLAISWVHRRDKNSQ